MVFERSELRGVQLREIKVGFKNVHSSSITYFLVDVKSKRRCLFHPAGDIIFRLACQASYLSPQCEESNPGFLAGLEAALGPSEQHWITVGSFRRGRLTNMLYSLTRVG